MDDREIKQQELQKLQEELKTTGMSRRKFLDRLKAIGIGFGAAAIVGVEAASARTTDADTLSLQSTNPAIGDIIEDGREQAAMPDGDPNVQVAQYYGYRRYYYRRFYRRGYRRFYRRYRRFYRRYRRFYY